MPQTMDDLRLHAVAARVAAWHNRHPLARRITAAQVQSIGYVALPYSVAGGVEPALEGPSSPEAAVEGGGSSGGGASLRERALARSRHQADVALPVLDTAVALPSRPRGLKAAFVEDFIAPLAPRRVARWAMRHGSVLAQAPHSAPLREVQATALPPGRRALTLHVLTAAIEVGGARRRVLLGVGDPAAVLGPRLWSRARLGTLAGSVAALALAIRIGVPMAAPDVTLLAGAPAPSAAVQAAASAPAGAASHAEPELTLHAAAPLAHSEAHAPAASPEPAPDAHASQPRADAQAIHADAPPGPALHADAPSGPQLQMAAVREAPAAATAAPVGPHAPVLSTPPLDVEPRLGKVQLPPLDLPHKDAAKAASRQAREERAGKLAQAAQGAASVPAVARPTTPMALAAASAAGAAPRPTAAPMPTVARGAPAFAVSTRLLRTRAEADQMAAAMSVLLQGNEAGTLRIDVLPQGDDWRVVGWPFPAVAQADKARALLAARGMRVAVVDF